MMDDDIKWMPFNVGQLYLNLDTYPFLNCDKMELTSHIHYSGATKMSPQACWLILCHNVTEHCHLPTCCGLTYQVYCECDSNLDTLATNQCDCYSNAALCVVAAHCTRSCFINTAIQSRLILILCWLRR